MRTLGILIVLMCVTGCAYEPRPVRCSPLDTMPVPDSLGVTVTVQVCR